jgi:NAD dependent epimerase/dehydratase
MSLVNNGPVLVTGADGFIGSHVLEELLARGTQVRALVMYNSFNSWGWLDRLPAATRDGIDVVAGDIRDADCVRQAVRGCRGIVHLAALIAIPFSYVAPEAYVDTNVKGTLNLLLAARDLGVARFVHTSTSEVYGTAQTVPISEEHRLHAQSPYAASKIGADQMALAWHGSFGTPVTIIRPFNTYGPRQSARAVIPTIITQLLAGDTLALGNLTPTRDFTYVADTVEAFVRIGDCPAAVGRVVNIGSGRELSIGELVERIEAVLGRRAPVEREEERVRPPASEVERLCADARLAGELFGWEPQVSLDEGLAATAEWIGGHLDRYRVGAYVT